MKFSEILRNPPQKSFSLIRRLLHKLLNNKISLEDWSKYQKLKCKWNTLTLKTDCYYEYLTYLVIFEKKWPTVDSYKELVQFGYSSSMFNALMNSVGWKCYLKDLDYEKFCPNIKLIPHQIKYFHRNPFLNEFETQILSNFRQSLKDMWQTFNQFECVGSYSFLTDTYPTKLVDGNPVSVGFPNSDVYGYLVSDNHEGFGALLDGSGHNISAYFAANVALILFLSKAARVVPFLTHIRDCVSFLIDSLFEIQESLIECKECGSAVGLFYLTLRQDDGRTLLLYLMFGDVEIYLKKDKFIDLQLINPSPKTGTNPPGGIGKAWKDLNRNNLLGNNIQIGAIFVEPNSTIICFSDGLGDNISPIHNKKPLSIGISGYNDWNFLKLGIDDYTILEKINQDKLKQLESLLGQAKEEDWQEIIIKYLESAVKGRRELFYNPKYSEADALTKMNMFNSAKEKAWENREISFGKMDHCGVLIYQFNNSNK